MVYTYSDIKEEVKKRNELFRDQYNNFFIIFEELYNPEYIKFVYIKNIFNKDEVETIFVFEDKIVNVTKQNLHYTIEENREKIIKKTLFINKDPARDTRLTILLDNGTEVIFDNIKDSNNDWAWEYGEDIKSLYKLL